jgi:hypothetical protein
MTDWTSVGWPYKGYFIDGDAQPAYFGFSLHQQSWHPTAQVLLIMPDNTVLQVERYTESTINCEDEELTKHFALFLAELAVDHFLPPPANYFRPMDFAGAMAILIQAAEECTAKEIRRSKLYQALDFLEKGLDRNWPAVRYRRALRGDRRNDDEREELRQELRAATRQVQTACVVTILKRMNNLAANFRENRPKIEALRKQLLTLKRKAVVHKN